MHIAAYNSKNILLQVPIALCHTYYPILYRTIQSLTVPYRPMTYSYHTHTTPSPLTMVSDTNTGAEGAFEGYGKGEGRQT